ncbi:hypothetical protein [Clostridium sp. B9]|uniref:hypothetical protein n=1 Tax=Clostridium sp. B9 TaxID=3423224 RepID=UPI003D2F24C8
MARTRKLDENKHTIILEDLNFRWEDKTIERIIKLWKCGVGLKEITRISKRQGDEVFLLLLHLAREGKITKREGHIWGIWE